MDRRRARYDREYLSRIYKDKETGRHDTFWGHIGYDISNSIDGLFDGLVNILQFIIPLSIVFYLFSFLLLLPYNIINKVILKDISETVWLSPLFLGCAIFSLLAYLKNVFIDFKLSKDNRNKWSWLFWIFSFLGLICYLLIDLNLLK